MLNINYAERAAHMTDAELAATVAVFQGEQQRRAAKPTDKRLELAQEAVRRHRERCFG